MIHFKDRVDAGSQLATLLLQFKNKPNTIALGLPRGGVIVAHEIAQKLNLPLDIIIIRKIGAPFNPELAVGALTQDGTIYLDTQTMKQFGISPQNLAPIIDDEKNEAKRRAGLYRGNRPPLTLKDKTVLLVDDGMATGSTMLTALLSVKKYSPKSIIAVIPVASSDAIEKIKKECDEIICPGIDTYFGSVGAYYDHFEQTEDAEVIACLKE